MSVPTAIAVSFDTERQAAVALCNGASLDDVNYVVEILNDKRAFVQVREHLLREDASDINVSWALGKIKNTLSDRRNIYECRPTQLGNARLALFRLMRDTGHRTFRTATWTCETYSPLSRIILVGTLYLTPTWLVS